GRVQRLNAGSGVCAYVGPRSAAQRRQRCLRLRWAAFSGSTQAAVFTVPCARLEIMSAPRWLSPAEQRAWRTHLALHKLLMHRLDRELQEHSLSVNDYEILVNLSESPDHRM